MQALERCPLFAFLGAAFKFERGFKCVLVLRHKACLEVVGIVCHCGKNRQAEEQKQRGESDAHEECGEVAEVAQEDAEAEARDEAHVLGQPQASLGAGLAAGFVTQKLQGCFAHLAKKPCECDEDERCGGHYGALDEDFPAPVHVEGWQAVGAVVEVAHGLGEERDAEGAPQSSCEGAYDGGKREVMEDDLALAVAAGKQRSDDGALFFNRGVGKHDEDKGHNHDDDVEQRRPHGGVAVYVVARVPDALVGVGVDEVVHARIRVR